MESILDCYFDNVFVELSRSSLLSRHKRQELTEYFTTIIEACTAAGECNLQTGCKVAVVSAMNYHQKTKKENGNVCLLGKFHNVLYLAVKLCFDFKLENTEIVAKLLIEIYKCEGTFERIFGGALFGVKVTHFISGWKSDFKTQNENILAVSYFLEHATKAKLEFLVGNEMKRFLDVPMASVSNLTPFGIALQLPQPDVLLILLQFGSTFTIDKTYASPIETFLKNFYSCDSVSENSISCLQYILRALPSIDLFAADSDLSDAMKYELKERLVMDDMMPLSRCGVKPPELQHLCRCVIRKTLQVKWELPFGINKLPIPTGLMDYLNLKSD